jgi:hypothetical protein
VSRVVALCFSPLMWVAALPACLYDLGGEGYQVWLEHHDARLAWELYPNL